MYFVLSTQPAIIKNNRNEYKKLTIQSADTGDRSDIYGMGEIKNDVIIIFQ